MPSLSRTYRPKRFSDVIDQHPIKETLRLAVATKIIGHAYLFAGSRGVGKTTLARVFAKALNCLQPTDGEPCNACDACAEMNAHRALDIIEMDAASHTGVDNVREAIIEHIRFVPHRAHKIYLLDEAHMLSTSAWNALLKTLEEPPPYAVFILITTELHKIPQTIQSRCQRFDFKRVSDVALAERVRALAREEGVRVAPDVVSTIVSHADGCVRDAEVLLEQLIGLGEKDITADLASLVLPLSRLPMAAELFTRWSERTLGPALAAIAELEEQGVPLLPLFDDMLQAVRHLLLASDSVDWRNKLAHGNNGEKMLARLVNVFDPAELSYMALLLMERRRDAKQGADARFCLELAATAVSLGLLQEEHKNMPPSLEESRPKAERTQEHATIVGGVSSEGGKNTREDQHGYSPTRNIANTQSVESQPAHTHSTPVSFSQIQSHWPAILRAIDQKSTSLTFIMKLSQPVSVDGNVVLLRFQYPFHRDKIIADIKTKHLVEDCIVSIIGNSDLRIDGTVAIKPPPTQEAGNRDVVAKILTAFGGHVVEERDGRIGSVT